MKIENKKRFVTVWLVLIMLPLLIITLFACKPKNKENKERQYFNNFSSTPEYTKVVETLRLPEGVTIAQFDNNSGYYITKKKVLSDEDRYGFCTENQDIVPPTFSSVLDIKGNYAVVTMPFTNTLGQLETRIGVFHIKGADSGQIDYQNYGFKHKYNPAIRQYSMLDDTHIIILGNKDSTDLEHEEATLYDYTSANGLLEVGVIPDINNVTKFAMHDGHIIASNPGIARLYNLYSINSEGYFIQKSYYQPFTSNQFDTQQVDINAYYLGNNWFIFSGIYASKNEYDGYEVVKKLEGSSDNYYMTIKSKRFNASSGQYYDTERVSLVANKYSSSYVKDIIGLMNDRADNEYINLDNPESMQKLYSTYAVPTSEIVKDGYSIVYTYFAIYDEDGKSQFRDTFQIYDKDANKITIKEAAMPIVYVNGVGLQNLDPNFLLPVRSIGYYKYSDGQPVTLKAMTESVGYDPYLIHSDMMLVIKIDTSDLDTKSAVFDLRGNQITLFEYDYITPYFGEYAIGGKNEPNNNVDYFKYYRIDKAGNVLPIDKTVFSVHYGTYVTRENGKYALYNNKGDNLISPKCSNIFLANEFFIDKKYVKSTVITVEDECGVIYKLA